MITKALAYLCIGLLISTLTFFALWRHADAEIAKREAVVAKAQVVALQAANERAARLQRTLDTLPKAEESHREVVRGNPAKCDRPAPVADSLSEAVRAANAARKVPGNP